MKKNLVIAVAAVFFMCGGIVFPAQNIYAADELPVEKNIALLAEEITLSDALKALKKDIAENEVDRKKGQTALKVLAKLAEQGVPVEKAYEAVSGAVERGEDTGGLLEEGNAASLIREAAQEKIRSDAEESGMKAEDVASAVEVLDGLVEKGLPVEKARDVVKQAISEDRDPEQLKKMLTSEYMEQARENYEKEKTDKKAAGETFRNTIRGYIDGVIGKISGFFN